MLKTKTPYLDYICLMDSLQEYDSPKSKLTTMIHSGEVIRLRRGLYLAGGGADYSVKTLANKIYGPSYISFEYALSFYNLIPERVDTVTSASYRKNKSKRFDTPVGSFLYLSVRAAAYPHGVVRHEEGGNPFLIATKEKALCDILSKRSGIRNLRALATLLYDDLRMERGDMLSLDQKDLLFLAPFYRNSAVTLLAEYIAKERASA